MAAKILEGSWMKAIGGDFGIVFDGKRWISFECVGCAIAAKLIVPSRRLQNANHPRLCKRIGWDYEIRHNKELHNEWLREGKPYRKE